MLKIKNEKKESAEIYISGDIVDDFEGTIAQKFFESADGFEFPAKLKAQLDELKGKDLTVYINSDGGQVSAGLAMAHMLERHDGDVTCIVDGFACSIASQIFFAGKHCKMAGNSYLMIHKPTVFEYGNAENFRKTADILDTIQEGLETTYRKKALEGITDEKIHEMMNQETWLVGEKAAKIFDIELLEPLKVVNCAGSMERLKKLHYLNIPAGLKFEAENKGDSDKKPSPSLIEQKVRIAKLRAKAVFLK